MNKPLVSIIIPTFNRAHLLAETLESILEQTYTNWESIIIDDGSVDNTKQLLNYYVNKDFRIKYFERAINSVKGVNSCRNIGLTMAKGDYIQWFDSDDIMHPDKLQLQVDLLLKNNLNCVIGNFAYFRDNLNDVPISVFNSFKHDTLLTDFVSGNIILNLQSILWNKCLLNEIKFKESLSYAEDVEFIFNQIISKKFTFKICDQVLVYVRKHEKSLTDNFQKRDVNLINAEIKVRFYIWKTLMEHHFSAEEIKGALKMYLKALKYLLYIHQPFNFFLKIVKMFKFVRFSEWRILLKLLAISGVFLFFKKGMALYQKTINAI